MTRYNKENPRFIKENKFHQSFKDIPEDELLRAIRKDQVDSAQARAELHRRGWTDQHIRQYGGK